MSLFDYISSKLNLDILKPHSNMIIKYVNVFEEQDQTIINQINTIRKQVYADELKQYTENSNIIEPGELFIVCFEVDTMNVAGYISLTEPTKKFRLENFVSSNMIRSALKDCQDINTTYELRSLTVLPKYRGRLIAKALCLYSIKWIIMNGGTDIIGIAADYLVPFYKKINCKVYDDLNLKIGNMKFCLLSNTFLQTKYETDYKFIEDELKKIDYLDCSAFDFNKINKQDCYHGGSSWEVSGLNFNKRQELVVADVLDSSFEPSPNVIKTVNDNLIRSMMESPPTHSEHLIETISTVRKIPKDMILVSSGSSSIMYSVFPNLLTKKSKVLLLSPMYGEYKHIMENVIECTVDYFHLHYKNNYKIDLEKLDEIVDDYDMLIMVNPNSPTGVYCDLVDFIKSKQNKNKKLKIWVDETYIDYLNDKSLESLLPECPNLYICKSMSKCYALSGLRVAYIAGHVSNLKRYIPPWSVSLPAQLSAIEALKDSTYYSNAYTNIHNYRKDMENSLIESNFTVFRGTANFFLVFLNDCCSSQFVKSCRQYGVFLRDVTNMGIDSNCIRIAVKTPPQNEKIIKTIKMVYLLLTSL
jgi:histidinol-phosphate/aromatic aminotransferase/cobyric acid decarboxylase-like protein